MIFYFVYIQCTCFNWLCFFNKKHNIAQKKEEIQINKGKIETKENHPPFTSQNESKRRINLSESYENNASFKIQPHTEQPLKTDLGNTKNRKFSDLTPNLNRKNLSSNNETQKEKLIKHKNNLDNLPNYEAN